MQWAAAGKAKRCVMIVECAWCGASLGEKEPLLDTRPTSGICEDCVEQLEAGQTCSAPRLRSGMPRPRTSSSVFDGARTPGIASLGDMPTVRVRRVR